MLLHGSCYSHNTDVNNMLTEYIMKTPGKWKPSTETLQMHGNLKFLLIYALLVPMKIPCVPSGATTTRKDLQEIRLQKPSKIMMKDNKSSHHNNIKMSFCGVILVTELHVVVSC